MSMGNVTPFRPVPGASNWPGGPERDLRDLLDLQALTRLGELPELSELPDLRGLPDLQELNGLSHLPGLSLDDSDDVASEIAFTHPRNGMGEEAPGAVLSALERDRLLLEHLPTVRYLARRIHERLPQYVEL
jgi:hypothetical protein